MKTLLLLAVVLMAAPSARAEDSPTYAAFCEKAGLIQGEECALRLANATIDQIGGSRCSLDLECTRRVAELRMDARRSTPAILMDSRPARERLAEYVLDCAASAVNIDDCGRQSVRDILEAQVAQEEKVATERQDAQSKADRDARVTATVFPPLPVPRYWPYYLGRSFSDFRDYQDYQALEDIQRQLDRIEAAARAERSRERMRRIFEEGQRRRER